MASAQARRSGAAPSKECVKRLRLEYRRLKQTPVECVQAEPLPSNLLEWHYCLEGPEDTPYHGGYYHGIIVFPPTYPFAPPAIYMLTPSGRFQPNQRLCLSMSDFHPEQWSCLWSISSLLTGLVSFMVEDTVTTGSCIASAERRRQLARQSLAFNLRNSNFVKLFPRMREVHAKKQRDHENQTLSQHGTSFDVPASSIANASTAHTSKIHSTNWFDRIIIIALVAAVSIILAILFRTD